MAGGADGLASRQPVGREREKLLEGDDKSPTPPGNPPLDQTRKGREISHLTNTHLYWGLRFLAPFFFFILFLSDRLIFLTIYMDSSQNKKNILLFNIVLIHTSYRATRK